MKFYIDDKEIKTVITNAETSGSLELVSRMALFSYIYDSSFENYKAKTGSNVLIKDDNNENVFQGNITSITQSKDKKNVLIQAQDFLYPLLNTKITGRFKGLFLPVLKDIVKEFEVINTIKEYLTKQVNVLSLGQLSKYDIISVISRKIYGEEVKIYLDGNSKMKFLLPDVSGSTATFTFGKNIISASFTSENKKNISSIKTLENKDVVSGSVIKIVDEVNQNSGYFIVTKDKHAYGKINTMELELKERKI